MEVGCSTKLPPWAGFAHKILVLPIGHLLGLGYISIESQKQSELLPKTASFDIPIH
jgi:hypothetical protein